MAEKKGKGRRKIPMQRIVSEEDRLITFSKRRSGIYKKATEISTMCGADVGVLMFTPAGKSFAYGIPNIESIANRLMSRSCENQGGGGGGDVVEAFQKARLANLNKTFDDRSAYLRFLKKEGEQLAEEARRLEETGDKAPCRWWDIPVEDMTAEEIERMKVMMEEIKRSVTNRLRDLEGEATSSSIRDEVNGSGMPNSA